MSGIRRPLVFMLTTIVMMMASWLLVGVHSVRIDVVPMRVDNPKPDGSGVAFIRLRTDSRDAAAAWLDHFRITAIDFGIAGQALKLWNAAGQNCDGDTLMVGMNVPPDGRVCFWSETSAAGEFESAFSYVAVDSFGEEGPSQKVTVVNYNVQACPGIPDLGQPGFVTAPPSPLARITLSGLQIKFEVTAAYLRNQTAWLVDFFDFDNAAGGDAADGAGRTCSNLDPSVFAGKDFSQWWLAQPRADFNQGVHPTIEDALNHASFPTYNAAGTKWSVTSVGCDKVRFTATIPTAHLISNGAEDCRRPGSTLTAALASGLNFTAKLYVHSLRPRDVMNPAAGYYKSSFIFPFSFRLQKEVSDIQSLASGWAFRIAIWWIKMTSPLR